MKNRLNIGLFTGIENLNLVKAINAIHSSPANYRTLDGFANEAGMLWPCFATIFKEIISVTPGNYLAE